MPTGNEDQTIPLSTASEWTKNYRTANPGEIIAHAIGRKTYTDILNQEGCVLIRTYYAIDDDGNKQIVIVGVDANGNDLYNGVLGDRSYKSPPLTGNLNPLNS